VVADEPLGERAWIESRGLTPRKRLGQNFLLDRNILRQIITRAGWAAESPVLEIGPGGGALTVHLLEQGRTMTAVEIDSDLCDLLRDRFAPHIDSGALRLVQGDVLDSSLPELAGELRERAAGRPVWLAGNLPYGVTTPILLQCLEARDSFEGVVLMVQREYGERMLAGPGTKAYSSLSVWTAAQAETRLLLRVGRSVFWPRPGVESVVVELRFPRPAPFSGDLARLQRVLRGAFGQRRKTLENSLASVLQRPKQDVREGILAAGVDPQVRGETLDLQAFARLSETLGGV
jgi:16S rRNA (adenine1518-N6/adenine1519-N6)-dimethyltransferase